MDLSSEPFGNAGRTVWYPNEIFWPQQHPAQSYCFSRTPTGPITNQCSLLTWSNCGYPSGKAARPGPACRAVSSHALLAHTMQRICTRGSGLASGHHWFIMNISSNSLKRLPILQMGKVNHKDKMIKRNSVAQYKTDLYLSNIFPPSITS